MKKQMLSLLFASLALSNASALAGVPRLQPGPHTPVCLLRQYTAEHMAANPKQKLNAIYVKLSDVAVKGQHEIDHYTASNVIGLSDGKFYGNDLAGCTFKADGSAQCQVDCDGGSFGLYPRLNSVLMQITKDYYFPLYLNGATPDSERPGDELSFDGNDKDNNEYLLQEVDVRECDRAIQLMKRAEWGC
jgi:hypothetical protein